MATTTNHGPSAEELPGYGAWLDEQDRTYWIGILRTAAEAHFATLACTCGEAGRCEHCRLSEALAYTESATDTEVWHEDDVIELAVDGDLLDLAALERACLLTRRGD